ncbi:CheR family methyltransferase [Corallococcus interemptor]|uniref:CheR family methyltransferase n=1 Tax=Corallococcus interemptor TaxID=2316720 RepID=UPI003CFFE0FC
MIGGVLPRGFKEVLALVEERAGLAAPSCLAAAMEGIQRAMARASQDDVDAYLRELSYDNALFDDLLTELTIGETYFFRTHEHFDHLRRVVLPELRERRGQEHLLRAWSAACSSGEEPYSIAALLMAEGWEERMSVRATDVSRTALQRAQQARYTDWSLRGPSADRMRPHLKQEGRFYWLSPDVKRHVQLGYLNLALETWPSAESGVWQLDVIFCRNVLIYFNRATIEGVARRLHASLEDGGYLFTGPSDPPLADYAPLEPVLTEWGVLYRKPPSGSGAGHFVPLQPLQPLPPLSATVPAPPLPEFRPPPAPPAPPVAPPPPVASTPAARPGESSTSGTRTRFTLSVEALEAVRAALARGDWREAARRAGAQSADPEGALAAVRALANLDPRAALYACEEASVRHPLVAGLRYLEALLLLGQARLPEAERSARQALYLEPGLAVGHLLLGHVLRRQDQPAAAARAYREAEGLCRKLPPEALVPLAEGERAGALADVARDEARRLERMEG